MPQPATKRPRVGGEDSEVVTEEALARGLNVWVDSLPGTAAFLAAHLDFVQLLSVI